MDQKLIQLLDDYATTHQWADDSIRKEFAQVCLRRFEGDHRLTPKPTLVALAAYASLMQEYERSKRVGGNHLPRSTQEEQAYLEVSNWLLSYLIRKHPRNFSKRIVIFTPYSVLLDFFLKEYDYFRPTNPPVAVSVDV